MSRFIYVIVFFIFTNSSFSQTITGKIVDVYNNPIPYVTLQIGSNYGVITNEEGVFKLEIDNFSDLDVVSLSCLGYKLQAYKLADFNKEEYVLEAFISELSEVFVTNKPLSIQEILTNVRANIPENYLKEGKQRVFKRQTSNYTLQDFDFDLVKSSNLKKSKVNAFNKKFDSIKGSLISKNSRSYDDVLLDMLQTADSLQIAVIKATKLVNTAKDLSTDAVNGKAIQNALSILDSSFTYKLKSGLFTLEDSLKLKSMITDSSDLKKGDTKGLKLQIARIIKNNTLVENSNLDFILEDDSYEYRIEGISYIDTDAAYIISFTPDRRSAKYTGKMYVNTSDFAVVKLEYQFAENRTGQKFNLKLLMGIKYEENAFRSTVIFKKNENNAYSLYFISQESGRYVYFNRSLKFTRNNTIAQIDKQILKLNLMLEQDFKVKTELYFINNLNTESASNFEFKEDYPIIYLSKYDAAIWKNYNVLSPVQDIIDYALD